MSVVVKALKNKTVCVGLGLSFSLLKNERLLFLSRLYRLAWSGYFWYNILLSELFLNATFYSTTNDSTTNRLQIGPVSGTFMYILHTYWRTFLIVLYNVFNFCYKKIKSKSKRLCTVLYPSFNLGLKSWRPKWCIKNYYYSPPKVITNVF